MLASVALAAVLGTSTLAAPGSLAAPQTTPRASTAPAAPAAATAQRGHPWWAGKLLSARPVAPGKGLPAGTRVQRMKYLSSTPAGRPTVVTGLTLVPRGPAPAGGWPVISWAHGTTGIADRCAPSIDPNNAGYGATYGQFLRSGYAIAATDYPGLGTPGTHPYLIAESEARSVIDAVPAARDAAGSLGKRWFGVGHSQGGQAAVGVAEIADDYDSGLDFRGAVGYAPAPNLTGSLADLGKTTPVEATFYTMMLVGLRTQHPELRYADYLGPRARALLPAARSLCIDELVARFTEARVPSKQYVPKNKSALNRLRDWFAANEIGNRRADGPMFVAQGGADVIVQPALTDELVAASRGQGSTVRYRKYPRADHGTVLDAASRDVLDWLGKNANAVR